MGRVCCVLMWPRTRRDRGRGGGWLLASLGEGFECIACGWGLVETHAYGDRQSGRMCVCVCLCVCVCVRAHARVHVCGCMCLCIYACMRVCMMDGCMDARPYIRA